MSSVFELDERAWRSLAQELLAELSRLLDPVSARALEETLVAAIRLPDGQALRPLRAAITGNPATRDWARLRFGDTTRSVGQQGRHLAVEAPAQVLVGTDFGVQARIQLQPADAGIPLRPFPVTAPGTRLVISASVRGLAATGALSGEVTVPVAGDSDWVYFGFVAPEAGRCVVTLRVFRDGTYLGEFVTEINAVVRGPAVQRSLRSSPIPRLDPGPGEVTLAVSRAGSRLSFQFFGGFPALECSAELVGDRADSLLRRVLAELTELAEGPPADADRAFMPDRIRRLGTSLWSQTVPPEIREQFWLYQERITSFNIASDLAFVPWEVLRPVDGTKRLTATADGFLADEMPIARRITGHRRVRDLPLDRAAYVVSADGAHSAQREIDAIRGVLGTSDLGVCESRSGLGALLDGAGFGLLHFACHNWTAEQGGPVVRLVGGPIDPIDLSQARATGALLRHDPLVVFNACHSVGQAPTDIHAPSWAEEFLIAGAGAFIGSTWSVRDAAARRFATVFYAAMLAGETLGRASLRARGALRKDNADDATRLAYAVYGDPAARHTPGGRG